VPTVQETINVDPSAGGPTLRVTPAETREVGKWPEGIAVTPDAIWVAESGARSVVRLGRAANSEARTSEVGRLPVDLGVAADGTVFCSVVTDHELIAIDPASGSVRSVAHLPDYPQALAIGEGVLWALLYDQGSSENSSVVRVDAESGAQKRSQRLGKYPSDLVESRGRLWLARDHALTVLDATSLEKVAEIELGDLALHVLALDDAIFVGAYESVLRVDAETQRVTHRLPVKEHVSALAAHGHDLALAGDAGMLWVLHGESLVPRVKLEYEAPSQIRALVADGDALYVTTHRGRGSRGSVLAFRPTAQQPWP
jgi:DNA-binding beta-propeller fold protein YncE